METREDKEVNWWDPGPVTMCDMMDSPAQGHPGLTVRIPVCPPVPAEALRPGAQSVPGGGAWLSAQPQPSGEHTTAGRHQHSGELGGQGWAGRDPMVCGSG